MFLGKKEGTLVADGKTPRQSPQGGGNLVLVKGGAKRTLPILEKDCKRCTMAV